MKKSYKCEIDCANCANKIEDAAGKIEGIDNLTVNFMTQKITIEAENDVFENVVEEFERVMKKVEPDSEFYKK